jgi:hypothetical protein
VLGWALFLLVPLLLVGGLLWQHQRKAARREREREERAALLLAASRARAAGGTHEGPWIARAELLSPAETVLYYALKSALPDHEVFARVSLAALVEVAPHVSGAERAQRQRELARHELGFLVCDKSLRAVAAVDTQVAADALEPDLKARCLAALGVPLLRLDPAVARGQEEIRELVLAALR